MTENRKHEVKLTREAARIFTPGRPITDPKLFSGREELINDLRSRIPVTGENFVLYGERGVGKTSFCNILFEGYRVHRHNCSEDDDFKTIFLRVLTQIGEQFIKVGSKEAEKLALAAGGGTPASAGYEASKEGTYEPVEAQRLDLNFLLDKFKELPEELDAIVLDEFQNVKTADIQTQIIEVIKGMSDRNISTKIIFVGIGSSGEDLLASTEYPQYKDRHFTVRKIPRMNFDELKDILDKRQNLFNIKFGEREKEAIARLSSGYPHHAHNLALGAVSCWIARNLSKLVTNFLQKLSSLLSRLFSRDALEIEQLDVNITHDDLLSGIKNVVRNIRESDTRAFSQLVAVSQGEGKEAVEDLLLLLANSEADSLQPAEIIAHVDITESKLKSIAAKLNLLIRRADKINYSLIEPRFRVLIKCREYTKQHDQNSYRQLFEKSPAKGGQ